MRRWGAKAFLCGILSNRCSKAKFQISDVMVNYPETTKAF